MAIRFNCDCGQTITARSEYAGRKVQCVGCKKILVVPGTKPAASPSPPPSAAKPTAPPPRPAAPPVPAPDPARTMSPNPDDMVDFTAAMLDELPLETPPI